MKTLNAIEITEETLVGSYGEFPRSMGNCFSVLTEDEKWYKIVNFYVENLRELFELGLTWPVNIAEIGDNVAVIHDERIHRSYFRKGFCETCCPEALLPLPQRLAHMREEACGDRKIIKGKDFDIISENIPGSVKIGEPPKRDIKMKGWMLVDEPIIIAPYIPYFPPTI